MKHFISNGNRSGFYLLFVQTEKGVGLAEGSTCFLLERDRDGFTIGHVHDKMGERLANNAELVFQDCKIPKNRILPNVTGLKGPLGCLTQARYGIAWGSLGAAMGCFISSKDYSLSRIQFDKPIASFQLVQNKLAWMLNEITKGQLLALQLGRMKDNHTMIPEQVSLAKMNNVEIALDIARVARDLHGANGISGEYPIMRHLMIIESVYSYEGTYDMHTLILGEDITGISAFR